MSPRAPRKALGAILSFRVDKYLVSALSIPKMPAFLTFFFFGDFESGICHSGHGPGAGWRSWVQFVR